MKKFITVIFAAAAIFATVSCEKQIEKDSFESSDELISTPQSELINPITVTFRADAETKVSISGEGTAGAKTAVWDEGDQIKIVWFNGVMKSATATADTYGTAATTFTATVEEADFYYAVYPATVEVTLDEEGNFTVNFPGTTNASTTFGEAAWYAAKTTAADKSFAFHPISAVIKFSVDGSAVAAPEQVYFRSVNGGLHKLHGHAAITFASDNTLSAAPIDGAAHITFTVAGAGAYYAPIPGYGASETTGDDGFILQIKKTGDTIPAAYYSGTITQEPGMLYNVKSAIDGKVIRNYYVATSSQGTGDGLSQANAATLADLKVNAPAFKFGDKIAGALLLDGATINFLGDENAYTEPIGVFNTSNSTHSYTIVGGVGGGTTTITTTSSSIFNAANATVAVNNITFSGCSSDSAVKITIGKISFDGCVFSSNSASNGGAATIGSTSATDADLKVSFNNTLFDSNTTSGYGGVVLVPANSSGGIVSFNNCLFANNTATSQSGGVAYTGSGTTALFFNNCSFSGTNAKSNGVVIYLNHAGGRLGMNNCTINGGSTYGSAGADNKKSNGSLITNKGLSVIANSTLWSKDGYGAWGLIALGASGVSNGSSVVNCLVRNGTSSANTSAYAAFGCNTSYYQNVQWCVYTGAKGVGSGAAATVSPDKHTFANSWDLGVAQGQLITGASYKNKSINNITQYYYLWTNTLAAPSFTKATKEQISNVIAKTGESADDAKDGFGKLFLDWLEEVDGLETDIIGTARPTNGFKPGSVE